MRRLLAIALLMLASVCRYDPDPEDREGRAVLRVGYMPNVTHAPALVGFELGVFAEALGPGVVIEPKPFAAGPAMIEALFAGELDVAYVGPSPAINAHEKSRGRALRVIAGAASGGASLIVQAGIERIEQLVGRTVATPAHGNTQDVALRTFLAERGLLEKVDVRPVEPADIDALFQRGSLAAAWVPEPWASRLVLERGGRVLVDERTLWPNGEFPTTLLVAATSAIEHRPELLVKFLEGHRRAVELLERHPALAKPAVAAHLERLQRPIAPRVLSRALEQLHFTLDPLPAALAEDARRAHRLGFLDGEALEGLVTPCFVPSACAPSSSSAAPPPTR